MHISKDQMQTTRTGLVGLYPSCRMNRRVNKAQRHFLDTYSRYWESDFSPPVFGSITYENRRVSPRAVGTSAAT
jgi:hypothetical protein